MALVVKQFEPKEQERGGEKGKLNKNILLTIAPPLEVE